jgi:Holliday junction resolvasome RuvABC ATP-dependent DNA helicase subunit
MPSAESVVNDSLREEHSFFEDQKNELIKTHPEEFALIKGRHLVGTFVTAAEALETSSKRFGNAPTLIIQILPGPLGFEGIVGQQRALERLKAFANLYRAQGRSIGHLLFVGPHGIGKRALARAFAQEYGLLLKEVQAGQFERIGDLAAALNDVASAMRESKIGGVLLLNDLQKLRVGFVDLLNKALGTFSMQITVGKGIGARAMNLALEPFTCLATVPKESDCPPELISAFPVILPLDGYSESELCQLAERRALAHKLSLEPAVSSLLAELSGGIPQQIDSLVQHLTLIGTDRISEHDALETLSVLGRGRKLRVTSALPSDFQFLSGIDFEKVVSIFLATMGFQVEITRATGDGGVDIEAVLDRPIVGGRYLIQCKRFAPDNLVGSATVREFYGAVIADRKAVKGVLITTSGFTVHARQFAENLPIELIDGDQLTRLLSEKSDG